LGAFAEQYAPRFGRKSTEEVVHVFDELSYLKRNGSAVLLRKTPTMGSLFTLQRMVIILFVRLAGRGAAGRAVNEPLAAVVFAL
jgi:hypothetical protein